MIQLLRTAHRRAFVGLALVLPVILVLGLAARRPQAAGIGSAMLIPANLAVIKQSDRIWRGHAIATEFLRDSNDPAAMYVGLSPEEELNEPDLLLYWTESDIAGEALPADAQLLGAFMPGKLYALERNEDRTGRLVLYSGAHHVIVDVSLRETLP